MLLAAGCQPRSDPDLAECGNGIVEPSAGEDCEGDTPGCGAVGSGTTACRFVCTEQGCPPGFACGVDAICRQPCLGYEGDAPCSPFETLSTDLSVDKTATSILVNVAGDGRPEVIAVQYELASGQDATAHVIAVDGDAIVTGPTVSVGPSPRVVRLEAGEGPLLISPRGPLPIEAAAASEAQRQALVFGVGEDLVLREKLMQGPTVVDPGPLRLFGWARPPDVPPADAARWLLGFGDGTLWQHGPGSLPLQPAGDAADLVGPVSGQPFDTAFASGQDALASAACEVIVYAYRGQPQLRAANLCDGVAGSWTSLSLSLPALPTGVTVGDGLVLDDLDGDGLDDLVVTGDDDRIYSAYASGIGTFHSSVVTQPGAADGRFDGGVGWPTDSPRPADASLGVIAAGDFNGDQAPDFITRSTWIRSCSLPQCGTCDRPNYRCDVGLGGAPGYRASAAGVLDYDGDGQRELLVSTHSGEPDAEAWFPVEGWGAVAPAAGDLLVIEAPGSERWSAQVLPLPAAAELRASGDLDGDGADELVLRSAAVEDEDTDELWVIFGGDTDVVRLEDFARIVDLHVDDDRTLAVVSEEVDGQGRRLTTLSADATRNLVSTEKLGLQVVPRVLVAGRFLADAPQSRGLAVVGEDTAGGTSVELLTRGATRFFDGASRGSSTTALWGTTTDAARSMVVAVDLDGDERDEVVVFGADGSVVTLAVSDSVQPPALEVVDRRKGTLPPLRGRGWPGSDEPASAFARRDLDGDGDLDLWTLTAEPSPRLLALRNLGDGRLDLDAPALSVPAVPELSVCDAEPAECAVEIRAFAAFAGPTDRSRGVSETAVDVLLVARRALFLWTVDPLDPTTADALEIEQLAVITGGRAPLSPRGGHVLAAIGDLDGDGVDDVVAGGQSGIRWLSGLAVNP